MENWVTDLGAKEDKDLGNLEARVFE